VNNWHLNLPVRLRSMRPKLDSADLGFAHPIGQAAKIGATDLDSGYAQKG
jgi:hypothetical protein